MPKGDTSDQGPGQIFSAPFSAGMVESIPVLPRHQRDEKQTFPKAPKIRQGDLNVFVWKAVDQVFKKF